MEKIKLSPGSRAKVVVSGGSANDISVEHLTGPDGYIHDLYPLAPIPLNEDHLIWMLYAPSKSAWSNMWFMDDKRSLQDIIRKGRYDCICTFCWSDDLLEWQGDLFIKIAAGQGEDLTEALSQKYDECYLVVGLKNNYLICSGKQNKEAKRSHLVELPIRPDFTDVVESILSATKKNYEEASSTRLDYLLSSNLEAANSTTFEAPAHL